MPAYRRAAAVASLMMAAALQGCQRDCCGPDRGGLSLFVGARVDSAAFRSRGEFALELVPADQTGQTFISDVWTITSTLVSPTSAAGLALATQRVEPPDTQLAVAAIDIDDSPSMAYSDPQRVRAGAAQLFWQTLLGAEPRNQCALLDFGGPASPGLHRTRLLQTYTSVGGQLDAQLASIQPLNGSTPLYHSALEVVRWTDSLTEARYGRYVVIMTDGQPSDTSYRDSLFAAAKTSAVRFFAVGLGPASDRGVKTDPAAVAAVRELATRTGGIYLGVTSTAQLLPALQSLASEPTSAKLLAVFDVPGPFPARGQVVSGRVTVIGQRGAATANWAFVAP